MGPSFATYRDVLAQVGNPTSVAGATIGRQRCTGRNPREEPDALAGTSGSVRGAPGNRRPYRDYAVRGATPVTTGRRPEAAEGAFRGMSPGAEIR